MENGIDPTSCHSGTQKIKESDVFVYDVEISKDFFHGWESIGSRKLGSRFYHGDYCSVSRDLPDGSRLTKRIKLIGAPISFINSKKE